MDPRVGFHAQSTVDIQDYQRKPTSHHLSPIDQKSHLLIESKWIRARISRFKDDFFAFATVATPELQQRGDFHTLQVVLSSWDLLSNIGAIYVGRNIPSSRDLELVGFLSRYRQIAESARSSAA